MAIYKGKSEYSKVQADALLSEVMSKDRILLMCEKHQYVASETPPEPQGCKDCWQAYWWQKIASTPPHLRRERLDEAFRMLTEANRLAEKGEFDFIVNEHPEILIEKSDV